ncbi:hypothetical protein TNCV_981481 [Trichonephila clavipes]|nr:hypothetical protein TNCV_981481 [Trichonephila clavipes]
MDTLTTLGKLPSPATHHLLTKDVQPIDLTELTMNFNRCNALCIQELYHRPNLASGVRRNKSFHFGPLLPRYGRERILFSDEAHFWLNGYVNKQNCRIWSKANPEAYVETPLHPEKLTVWCALWAGGILLQKR